MFRYVLSVTLVSRLQALRNLEGLECVKAAFPAHSIALAFGPRDLESQNHSPALEKRKRLFDAGRAGKPVKGVDVALPKGALASGLP